MCVHSGYLWMQVCVRIHCMMRPRGPCVQRCACTRLYMTVHMCVLCEGGCVYTRLAVYAYLCEGMCLYV